MLLTKQTSFQKAEDNMAISEKVLKLLNEQIANEYGSGYIYRAMAADMKAAGFPGYGSWLEKQCAEEFDHAEKIIAFVEDMDAQPEFLPIAGVTKHYECPVCVAEASLANEQKVSEQIRTIFRAAREADDLETQEFLRWFITEQVEEESNARDNIAGFKAGKDDRSVQFLFDKSLGGRKD